MVHRLGKTMLDTLESKFQSQLLLVNLGRS